MPNKEQADPSCYTCQHFPICKYLDRLIDGEFKNLSETAFKEVVKALGEYCDYYKAEER